MIFFVDSRLFNLVAMVASAVPSVGLFATGGPWALAVLLAATSAVNGLIVANALYAAERGTCKWPLPRR